jgi:hypothetical protein
MYGPYRAFYRHLNIKGDRMNNKLILPDEEENTQPQLQLIQGGKEPPDENWLKDMAEGTVFLCRTKGPNKTIDVQEYHVVYQAGEFTKLMSNINNKINMWVDTLMFSRNMELAKVIGNE